MVGMSEAEVQMALGQVSDSVSKRYGDRRVMFSNLGHPMDVVFVKNRRGR
jgi:type 1 glutamine amidotransferase